MLLKRQNNAKTITFVFCSFKAAKNYLFWCTRKLPIYKIFQTTNIQNLRFYTPLGTNKIKVLVSKRKTLCLVSLFARNIGTNLFQSGTLFFVCVKLAATFDAPLCLFEA
jgi:hypothetical protein